ncbi:AfsR/SARP family transcriptional regulator [Nocardioides sediminis]|uniref:AfsR/SARP family transcriptional regulator n=1 Tax=Nocardioides sediminis TaxID=433648 RepID=UPI00131F462D|nr:BTAD domain-containing putative transcriptional regulator [Nocardioides sediminis]
MLAQARLMGRVEVRGADGMVVPDAAWRTAKTFDLFRVLALAGGRSVPMDRLLELFWPTADEAHGRTSLRTATSQVRKVVGAEAVHRVGNGLALRDVWVDVTAYRGLAASVEQMAGNPARVVGLVGEAEELYVGDLEVAGSECPLLDEARDELRRLRLQLLLAGAEAAARCANWTRSLELARRAASVETSDRSTRALMRAWFAVGETAKPVEEFERLRRHLADEYGVDPAPQTRALYLEVVSACAEWPPRQTTVGRDREIQQVVSAMTGWLIDPDGPAGVVWLVGPRGSGRETVAREAARTLMIPLADQGAEPGAGATVELLPDQGALSKGLAAMLQMRATTRGRIMIVPVSELSDAALGDCDAVVRIQPLDRGSFRRLLGLVLQGVPGPRLEDELWEKSRGLPGLACREARRRLEAGDLSWTPRGVDTVRRPTAYTRTVRALATIPFALLGLLGGEGPVMAEADSVVVEKRVWHQPATPVA